MNLDKLLILFIGLPAIVYLGVKLEIWRRQRRYKEDETQIQIKYQDNLFVLKPQDNEKESENDDIKKAS